MVLEIYTRALRSERGSLKKALVSLKTSESIAERAVHTSVREDRFRSPFAGFAAVAIFEHEYREIRQIPEIQGIPIRKIDIELHA